ncbi:hypothetical protein Tco_0391535, partial [Tanacetum coccineum]
NGIMKKLGSLLNGKLFSLFFLKLGMKRIFKERNKKKAKYKQIQARNEKDKVLSHPSEENTT